MNVSYTATLTATGGTGTGYAWNVSAGNLPAGMTLSGGGVLSGTPTATGTFNFTAAVTDSSQTSASAALSLAIAAAGPLTDYEFTGDTSPVHDPSIIQQGSTYYVFSTDASSSQGGFIPIRCSTDKIAWSACGYVFTPCHRGFLRLFRSNRYLGARFSYFNGTYHVYYAASSLDRTFRPLAS